MSLNVLSLFSGIGGLELGLERAGMTTVGQVEIDPYCQRVLAKHWPDVPRHDDVRTAAGWWFSQERPTVDVICGGFPCQPFSTAGLRNGVTDERWGWPWFFDAIRAIRPRYVVVENVAALLRDSDAFGWLLGDLAELGFDAEWTVLSACAVGAPHTRDRLFLVAYPNGVDGPARLGTWQEGSGAISGGDHRSSAWPDPVDGLMEASRVSDRVANGLAVRLVRAAGNAVVPQVSEYVGRLIVAHEARTCEAVA
jgi:DNA (cytosine-5)-methyltransferase 1